MFTEEPRRSGRATKGVNTKERDIPEDAAPKRKGKAKKKQPDEDGVIIQGDEKIRCICGQYEEEEDEPRDMICCDKCEVWQHNDCMGLPATWQPKQYFCERCRPEKHKDLLAAVAKGERPWEETARQREVGANAEPDKKQKKGKKGRKSGARPSDVQSQDSLETTTPQKENVAPAGQKRKHTETDTPIAQESKKPRQTPKQASPAADVNIAAPTSNRKTSTMAAPERKPSQTEISQLPVVSRVEELENGPRKKTADALIRLFVAGANSAQKEGSYSIPSGRTITDVGNDLGLRVEHALYVRLSGGAGEPSGLYTDQLRTINFNVKKNGALRDRILNGSLSPAALAVLPASEMASKELQERDEQMRRESEKQHMIIQEPGPRIRRTHKGEEYVDESHQVAEESTNPHRRASMMEDDLGDRKSPEPVEKDTVKAAASPVRSQKPTRIDTRAPPRPAAAPERKSSSNFNIQNVWSSVQGSPDADRPHFGHSSRQASNQGPSPTGPGAQADAEIDALLKDDAPESPPYSPKDYPEDTETIWKGTIEMMPVAQFRASAKFAAGAKPLSIENLDSFKWSKMIPQVFAIDGRIKPEVADNYICGLKYSHSTDVVIITISPQNDQDRAGFDALFDYFTTRTRFGVGASHANPAVKDIYLIPIEKEEVPEKRAEFLHLLESPFLTEAAPERFFLATFAVKLPELTGQQGYAASPSATPQDAPAPVEASPIVEVANTSTLSHRNSTGPLQRADNYSPPAPSYGPSAAQYSPPPQQQLQQLPPDGSPAPQNLSLSAIAAEQVLGDLKDAPAVVELLKQAPDAGVNEMNVVKSIIEQNPQAANELRLLHQMLIERQRR
ncbi:MAG: hypothetical protein Q9227_002026 [Pyrenula ochraceoflavens]